MKKKGFTLAELLITVAVVGIVAAICVPAISGLNANKKKGLYVKAYNTLTNMTNEIISDTSLYSTTYDDNGDATCSGLRCWAQPEEYDECEENSSDGEDWACSGAYKFSAIFATKVNYLERARNNNDVTLVTADGVEWTFVPTVAEDNDAPGGSKLEYEVTLNVSPDSNANQCTYSEDCTNPNEFLFKIDNNGGITAADALGMAYLQNINDLKSSQEDASLAAQIVSIASSPTDTDKMAKALNQLNTSTKK